MKVKMSKYYVTGQGLPHEDGSFRARASYNWDEGNATKVSHIDFETPQATEQDAELHAIAQMQVRVAAGLIRD